MNWIPEEVAERAGDRHRLEAYHRSLESMDTEAYKKTYLANPGNFRTDQLADPLSDLMMYGCSFEEFLTPSPEVHRGLWFRPSSSGSYERDGYLYGRISRNTEKQSWSFPCAEAITSFEEWQTIYGGYVQVDPSVYPLHQGFREGVNAIDEAFFEQKSLAVVYVNAWSGSHHHRVGEVTAQDGSLHIKISNICSPAGDDDIGYWAILIPIDKELASLPITVEQTEEFPSWEEWEALPENQYWTEWYKE